MNIFTSEAERQAVKEMLADTKPSDEPVVLSDSLKKIADYAMVMLSERADYISHLRDMYDDHGMYRSIIDDVEYDIPMGEELDVYNERFLTLAISTELMATLENDEVLALLLDNNYNLTGEFFKACGYEVISWWYGGVALKTDALKGVISVEEQSVEVHLDRYRHLDSDDYYADLY